MDKLLFKRILVAALTVLALVYVTYLLMSANFNMYPTENAVQATVSNSISADAFILRDESIIKNNTNGILSYTVSNGQQVEAKSEVAKVFSNQEDAVLNSQADQLERRISALQESQKSAMTGAVSVDMINNSISNNLTAYLTDVNRFDIGAVKSDAEKLLNSINLRQLLTGRVNNFNAQIETLTADVENLRAASGESKGTVITPKAGYFTEYCDGYESAFNFSKIDEMTLYDLHHLSKKEIAPNTAGKIISNVKWYVACELTSDQASAISIYDGTITVLFSEASAEPIPATLHHIRRDDNGKALVVLECDYMDNSLIDIRQEPIEIGIGSYSGLRVTKRAVHDDYVTKTTYDEDGKPHKEQKKVQGVYVLYGSEVQFKQISILYSTKDYVICDTAPKEGVLFNGETISLYDKVIVKGDDLYDGKVIS